MRILLLPKYFAIKETDKKQLYHLLKKIEPRTLLSFGKENFTLNLIISYTKEVRVRIFHWKILNNMHPIKILHNKMRILDNHLSKNCKEPDYI